MLNEAYQYLQNADWVGIIIGIIVTGFSIWFGYKNTIGAKNERTRSARNEILNVLFRNLVTNGNVPDVKTINTLILAKSIDHDINSDYLPDEKTFFSMLYARIMENELISSKRKNEILNKMKEYLDKLDKETNPISETEKPYERDKIMRNIFAIVSMSIIMAIIIYFLSSVVINRTLDTNSLFSLFGAISITLFFFAMFLTIKRIQENQKEEISSVRLSSKEYFDFEYSIFEKLKGLGGVQKQFVVKNANSNRVIFDLALKRGNKTYLFEIKRFRNYVSRHYIEQLVSYAKIAKNTDRNVVLFLVVNDKKYLQPYISMLNKNWDYVFDEIDLIAFRNEIVHGVKP
ncbi:MAG: hypothetical protein PHY95_02845 [Candidatus ainarchaeum sp.]|nr:hypothetical protein [Candidatus ainarchaeum sp.]